MTEGIPDISSIRLHLDGVTRSFAEWTTDFVNTYYPNVGRRCYRVPPLHFNQQRLSTRTEYHGLQLDCPDESHSRGDLAHTLVLECVERLGYYLQERGTAPFIISTLDYDNYLARVKAPPRKQGKENRPRRKIKTKDGERCSSQVVTDLDNYEQRDDSISHKSDFVSENCEAQRRDITEMTPSPNSPTGTPLDASYLGQEKLTQKGPSIIKIIKDSCNGAQKSEDKRKGNDSAHSKAGESLENKRSTKNITEKQRHKTDKGGVNQGSTPGTSASRKEPGLGEQSKVQESSGAKTVVNTDTFNVTETQKPHSIPTSSSVAKCRRRQTTKERMKGGNQAERSLVEAKNDESNLPTQTPARGSNTAQGALPPRPKDMGKRGQRGDTDVVILHPKCGILLMEVKSTGMPHPDWEYTEQDFKESILKAIDQVKRGHEVFHFIMPDLKHPLTVTLVIALPFMTRKLFNKVISDLSLDTEVIFLCQEDLFSGYQTPQDQDLPTTPESARIGEDMVSSVSSIFRWWENNIVPRGSDLCLDDMETIIGRVCGLLSIVSVWTRSKPRVEIRTTAEAISEAGQRISDIVLLPQQAALLANPSPNRMCLTGPMGSGKTLLLQLKGRQWLNEGKRVVVLNVRSSGRGRPIGHILEEAIGREDSGGEEGGTVERYDLASSEFDIATFHAELMKTGPVDNVCFVMDELTHHVFFLLELLMAQYPQCGIWCVAMFVRHLPPGFQHCRMGAVLRCPPSVQILLKELDLNPIHRDVYSTRSATRGLPCDGPPIIFVHHQEHGNAIRPHDCEQCADDLIDIMQQTLGLTVTGHNISVRDTKNPHSPRGSNRPQARPKAVSAEALSFKDILFLVCMPLAYYKKKDNELWLASPEDILRFCRYLVSCQFLARIKTRGIPIKIVVDNTSREIAIPSTDEIILTDVMGVQSLERKVVFFLPGGPTLSNDDVKTSAHVACCQEHESTHTTDTVTSSSSQLPQTAVAPTDSGDICIHNTRTGQGPAVVSSIKCAEKSTYCDTVSTQSNYVHQSQPPQRKVSPATSRKRPVASEIKSTDEESRYLFHSSTSSTKEDLNEALDALSSTPKIKDMSDVKRVFGNMMVSKDLTSKSVEQTSDKHKELTNELHAGDQTATSRMGMGLRGDSPWLLSTLKETRSTSTQDSRDYFQADAVFLVRDTGDEVGQTEAELQRIRRALSSLSMDDQDWLFMAAARCLSQLVIIIP